MSISKPSLLKISDVHFWHPGSTDKILEGIDLSLEKEEICALIGTSGCGKTTLLYLLAGLLRPCSGEILMDGQPLRGPHPKTAVILQEYGLFPWKTVEDNVALALKVQRLPIRDYSHKVHEVLGSLNIKNLAKRYPNSLSGGQRQRVAIARALIQEPQLLLMDEPFAALDAMTREEMQQVFKQLWSTKPFACLLVTHQVEEALLLGHKVVVLGHHPGTIRTVIAAPHLDPKDYAFFEQCRLLRSCLKKEREDGK